MRQQPQPVLMWRISDALMGVPLGLWKTLGTSLNLYGLSLTSADHGAFLIQLTTLIVPVAQGVQGVPIPRRIWLAVGIALAGLLSFEGGLELDVEDHELLEVREDVKVLLILHCRLERRRELAHREL